MKTINSFRSKLLALTFALVASVSTFAYDFGDDGLFFNIIDNDNKLVEVTYQHERSEENYSKLTHVTIPDTVLRGRVKYAVVSIGSMAFYKCKTLESIIIPDHIKSIGTNAFSECSALTSVSLPNTITYLNSSLFSNCTALRTFTIPDNITSIYGSVFESCSSLSEINIPSSVTSIGKYAFRYCNSLKSITIPNSVKSIYRGAFYKCKALTDITLPDSLTTVSQEMFYECTALESITIPIGVTHIEHNAFYWCSNLKTMTLHANIEYIDEWAFNQTSISTYILAMRSAEEACTNRVNKILHDIGQQYSTRKITINGEKVRDLVVPNTIDSISDYAFAYSYIASVNIPNNLKRINPTAFYKCPSLQSVHWNALDFEEVSSAANAPFNKVASQIHTFKFGRDIKHIPAYLCYDMNRLDSIEIPAGVKSIGKHAFAHCSPSVVICHASQVPNIDESAFSKDYVSNTILYVPAESVETYKESEQWNKFAHIVAIGEKINDTESDWGWGLVHNFAVDNFGYAIIENATTPSVQIIEAVGKSGHVDIPTEVIHNDTLYKVTGLGTGIVTTFRYSPDLTSVFIPKEILLVNNAVFADCPNLESIVVEEGNVRQDSRDNCNAVIRNLYVDRSPELVIGCKNTTIPNGVLSIGSYAFRGCKGLQEIEVPSSVTTIYQAAFYDCISLKSVVLGENITSINDLAFYNCYNLEKVVCLALTPPSKGASAFNNTPITDPDIEERAPIYVPDASVEVYKQAWKDYNIQPLSSMPVSENLFPTLWGLQRTHTIEMYDHAPNDGKRSGGYPLPFASVKDTVINGKTYLQFGDYVNGSDYSLFFLREENNKVLIYSSILQNDLVLYDYTLKLGDSLPAITSDHDYFSDDHFTKLDKAENIFTYVVTDVSTITLLDGIERKKWILKNKYLPIIEYVEGIGCYGENTSHSGDFFRLIHDHPYKTEYVGDHLVCVSKNGQLLYSMPQEEMNSFTLTCECLSQEDTIAPEDLFPTLWGLQRTGCTKTIGENENGTVWGSRSYLMQEIETATIDGKQYLLFGTNNIYDEYCSLWLREENNKILVYSAAQKKDLVLYDFTLNVGDSLSRLYVDYELSSVVDYYKYMEGYASTDPLVVTEVSTITLLDGKEYKKWTFDNGRQYVEGIGSFGTCYAHNDFYQLIADAPLYSDVYSQHLVCASKNGQLLYKMDDAEMEQLETECLCEIEPKWSETWCNQWNILSHGYQGPQDPLAAACTSIFWLSNNTVNRDGQEYIPLMCSSSRPDVESTNLIGELRFTEDKQVYFYYDNTEYLLYDFGAQVGDQLQIFSGIDNYNRYKTYTHVVTRREYLEDGRIKLTSIPFFDEPVPDVIDENYYLSVTWIEGVGSEHGIVHNNINYIPGMGTDWLLCAYRDGECRYTTDDPEYAPLGCVYNDGDFIEDAFPILSGLQRTVCNEYCGDTEDDNSANNTYKQTFDSIFFENNKPYILCNDYLLREEDNKILIYSQLLNKDLVLYDFTLEVGDSLPALYIYYHARNAMDWIPYNLDVVDYNKDFDGTIYPADTFVVTDISNVTLLDGKEYKKWTFDNGMEYVEGIGMYGGHRNGNFFGLIQEVVVPCHIGTHLVCASRNGKLLYQMDDAEMERLGAECLCEVEPSYKSQWCNTWNVFTHSGGARLDSEETWQYKLDRDTIINGKLYSTVIYYLTSDPSREYYMGAVRFGDDRKVYRAIGNSESVVYDFTAQVGDTLGPGVVYEVQVDSLTNLKTIYFHPYDRYEDKYIEYATVKWIEGVGSTDGFLLAKDYGTVGGASFYLLCAYRDDELKYAANKDLGCRYNAGEVTHDHFPTLAGLSRTIYEERNTNDTTRRDDFTKVVLDRSFPTLYHSQMYLRERDNKIFVVSRTYKNLTELYEYVLYDFTLEVGDSLPMLYIDYSSRGNWGPTYPLSILNVVNYRKEADGTIYPGDTLIVTEVSTITLLDGKEYKKWTFNNGMEYAEGIGSLSGDFYELIANKRTTEDLTASQLVCASQNGQLLYQMDDTEMERLGTECLCDYTSGPKKDNAKDGQIGGRPTPTQWNMLEMELRKMENGVTILQAETFSYTLEDISQQVNNKTYFQLARQSTKDTATTKSVVGALHFGKDEDNRVYFLRDGVEYVLYDFTAEPGDTVEIFAGVNNYPQETTYTHVVTGKDTLENGACRMILEVVFPDETTTAENAEKVWLAGLGSIDGIVHNAASRASNARSSETQTSVMLCAWRDDDCLYTTDHPDYDTLGCVYNTESTGVGNTTSSTSYQKILRNGHLLILHQGRIYNVMGVEIK